MMPTLNWIGKEKIVNHHRDVPYCVLDHKYSFDKDGQHEEDNGSKNMIIHGDNLYALKALLPKYEGKIKCIYIDPPYNTGNENWVYNDNVNDPQINKWLGEVVGKEGEDMTRHDKWLCMMYPRLKLLRKLLSNEGSIFISIDDNEIVYLRQMMDEIFGQSNFIAQITLLCNPKGRSQDKFFATCHEYLVVYSNGCLPAGSYSVSKDIALIEKECKLSDENGLYRLLELRNTHKEFGRANRPNLWYPFFVSAIDNSVSLFKDDEHSIEVYPMWPDGYEGCWTWGAELAEKDLSSIVAQKKSGKWKIYRKSYAYSNLGEVVKQKLFTIWNDPQYYTEKGQMIFGDIFPGTNKGDFPQPKSVKYIEEVLRTCTSDDDIILDSFSGSGTTAHAVCNLNEKDNGNRRFILVERMEYAETITAERVKRVIGGYGENSPIDADFSYYELGDSLLTEDCLLNENIGVEKIREYIWFTETKSPFVEINSKNPYLLGKMFETSYYFYYEKGQETILNESFLNSISKDSDGYVIYADACTLSKSLMSRMNIIFKKIPRDISKL